MGTLAGGRVLSKLLGNINASELPYLLLAVVIVNGVALSAVLIPTLKAVRINVAKALRVD
jgi:ABC-type lipoprotein release transport system permease subunit